MSVIGTGNHPKALWPGVEKMWGITYAAHDPVWSKAFTVKKSKKNFEELVQNVMFGYAGVKSQGGAVPMDSTQQGYTHRATHVEYALGYIITEIEIEDELYPELSMGRTKSLAYSMVQTKERNAANIFDRAFNSSYTYGDGLELVSTAHVDGVGGTWSNELSTASTLDENSLEDLVIQMHGATNDRGMQIRLNPKMLMVPRQLEFDACRILKSISQSGTANNDVNALRVSNSIPGGVLTNVYLTDANNWFLLSDLPDAGLICYQRRAVTFGKDNDFTTGNARAKATERYIFTNGDPRSIYGSAPA